MCRFGPKNAALCPGDAVRSIASVQELQTQHPRLKLGAKNLTESLELFDRLLRAPLDQDSSVFSVAYRTFRAADLLCGDLGEALRADSRAAMDALQTARAAFRRSFADQKAGEFLLSAEIARLRQELHECEQARENQRKRAVEVALGLEQNRKAERAEFERLLAQAEARRVAEVKQVVE